jgi:hypothetical protein
VARVLIIVENLPVPFHRRVWLECQALVADGYRVAIVDLMDDESRRSLLGKLVRVRVGRELAWGLQERAYLDVYRRLLADSTALERAGDTLAVHSDHTVGSRTR